MFKISSKSVAPFPRYERHGRKESRKEGITESRKEGITEGRNHGRKDNPEFYGPFGLQPGTNYIQGVAQRFARGVNSTSTIITHKSFCMLKGIFKKNPNQFSN